LPSPILDSGKQTVLKSNLDGLSAVTNPNAVTGLYSPLFCLPLRIFGSLYLILGPMLQDVVPMTDPLLKSFYTQRQTAKQRGIPWRLEYWEWLQIWQDSGHLANRGRCKGQWVMSHPGDRGAYESGNVRIVHCETNHAEGNYAKWRRYRERKVT
jgi:hypothetical protein